MNIFFLDRNIEECVKSHCDKHVVKMILEYAQLLSSVHRVTNPEYEGTHYKLTHKNHPDAIWARSSIENYAYLISLATLLGEEYTYRYRKVHKSIGIIGQLPIPELPDLPFTEPPKCVHDDFKGIDDTVEAYRAYYIRDKGHFCVWTKRTTPSWFRKDSGNAG
jgi:hypothetical protein